MSLVKFVPTYTTLSPSSFRRREKDGRKFRLLTLSAPHSVFSNFGGDAVTGKAEILYVVETADKPPTESVPNLRIARDTAPIGYQSSEELRGLLESLRVRQSFTLASIGDSSFDMRALAYVCGNMVGTVISGLKFQYNREACTVGLLSPTWNVPTVTNLTVAAGLAENGAEFATLARMARFAGCKSITLMSDVIPPKSDRALQGLSLGAFALKVWCNIINAAQSCSCAGMHVQAFFCGLSSQLKLRAHTDEGGLIRPILENVTYPPSVGVLAVGASSYFGLSPTRLVADVHVPQMAIGLFLEFVGTMVCSDPGVDEPTILVRDGPGMKPSNFPGLRPAFYKLMARFRSAVCEDYSLHPSTVGDDSSHDGYFVNDADDRHLDHKVIQPFYWVEPGPLSVVKRGPTPVMVQGEQVTLPLTTATLVKESAGYKEIFGRVPVGCAMFLRSDKSNPRGEGYQYILSPRYRNENGLSCMEIVVDDRLGTTTSEALFVEPDRLNVSERRWVTPHNSVPSPAEGISPYAQAIRFTYRGLYAEPTLKDWQEGIVGSFTGPLSVKGGDHPDIVTYTCRHVSNSNLRWLNSRGRYAPKHILDLAALPSNFMFTPPVLLTGVSAQHREPEDAEIFDQQLDATTGDTETTPVSEPTIVTPPPPIEGPDTELYADPDTGRRIRVPDAEVGTEERLGSQSG